MDEKKSFDIENKARLNYYLKEKWKLFVTVICLFAFLTMVRFDL